VTELADMVLFLHALSTSGMTGLIWFVQIVHYPMFAAVPPERFAAYAREHQQRTTRIVAPVMLVELVTATAIALLGLSANATLAWIGLAPLAAIWLSTAAVQMPLHQRLERGFDPGAVRALVRSNWGRTAAWSTRLPLALWMLKAGAAAG